jgi:hypothetical protein
MADMGQVVALIQDKLAKVYNRQLVIEEKLDRLLRLAEKAGERTEFGQIVAGLKARGVITQADIDRMERDGAQEVQHAG